MRVASIPRRRGRSGRWQRWSAIRDATRSLRWSAPRREHVGEEMPDAVGKMERPDRKLRRRSEPIAEQWRLEEEEQDDDPEESHPLIAQRPTRREQVLEHVRSVERWNREQVERGEPEVEEHAPPHHRLEQRLTFAECGDDRE